MKQKNRTTEKQKRKSEYENASRYIVYLLRCALNQIELKNFPAYCTWEVVWKLVERNHIDAFIGRYIQEYGKVVPAEIQAKGKKAYSNTLYRQICFDMEREKIAGALEEQKLSYLILKGVNIAKYYPEAGMRWMSDNDILCSFIQIDEKGGYCLKGETEEEIQYWEKQTRDSIQMAMEKCGFSLKEKGACHDAYVKLPMFKFEMHHKLFLKSFDDIKSQYYRNPWKRAIPDEHRLYMYHYSKEDEYIYFVTHAYKHLSVSGSGIRTLIDMYVYIKNNRSMDWFYVSSQLRILKLEDFELLLRNTAIHAFSAQAEMTTEEWNIVFYMIGSGTFGTSQNRILRHLETLGLDKKNSKNKIWCYMKERVWLSEDKVKEYFPFFYRHRFLKIFMPVYRITRGMLLHPKKLWTEWKILTEIFEK